MYHNKHHKNLTTNYFSPSISTKVTHREFTQDQKASGSSARKGKVMHLIDTFIYGVLCASNYSNCWGSLIKKKKKEKTSTLVKLIIIYFTYAERQSFSLDIIVYLSDNYKALCSVASCTAIQKCLTIHAYSL